MDDLKQEDILIISAAPYMLNAIESYLDLYDQLRKTDDNDDKRRILDSMVLLRKEMQLIVKKVRGKK